MRTLALLLLLTGCVYTGSPDEADAAEIEAGLLDADAAERVEGGGPPGWYWLLTTGERLLAGLGSSDPEFGFREGRAYPVRIGGVEGSDSFREFDSEPEGLKWSGDKSLYLVENELNELSLVQRARSVRWESPVLDVSHEEVRLAQAARYSSPTLVVSIWARKFVEGGVTRVAWWGYRDSTKEQEHHLLRLRIFDKASPEWPAIQRAMERAGPPEGADWSTRAGAAAFEELRLAN
jgi:hypothetical protein